MRIPPPRSVPSPTGQPASFGGSVRAERAPEAPARRRARPLSETGEARPRATPRGSPALASRTAGKHSPATLSARSHAPLVSADQRPDPIARGWFRSLGAVSRAQGEPATGFFDSRSGVRTSDTGVAPPPSECVAPASRVRRAKTETVFRREDSPERSTP
eukprot:scaffold655_cov379-Prasinococcus_capsulatus_cf.AAC.27